MNAPPQHGRGKLWSRCLILATLGTAVVFGALLIHRLVYPPPPLPPEVAPERLDPDVASAIAVARQKVLDDPHSPEAWGFLGKVLLANGLNNKADICLRYTEKLDRNNPRWPYYRAIANIHDNTDETIACLRRAIEIGDRFAPEVNGPRLQLTTLLIQEGRDEEAEDVLRIVREKNPADPQTIYLSALLLANRNDLSGSVTMLKRLTENPVARQKACAKLAQLYLRLGDSPSARKWDKIAHSLPEDPSWPDAYVAEMRLLMVGREQRFAEVIRLQNEHRYSDAVQLLNQMIENKEPALGQAYMALGNNLVHLARGEEAERAFENALRLSPDDAETYNRLALVRLFQGEERERLGDSAGAKAYYKRALDSARHAVRINPLLAEAQMTLGQLLISLGERQEAIVALRMCLRSQPEMMNAHLLLGQALAKEGQPVEARQHLQAAVRFAEKDDQRAKVALEQFEKTQRKSSAPPGKESPPP